MLRLARQAEIGFIRALASRADMAAHITDEDEAALAAYFADPAARVLIWDNPEPRGFAIFCDLDHPAGSVCLMRLALVTPGQGEGASFLNALVDYGFRDLGAKRLWLDTSGENLRAQRAYERAGFQREGCLRQHEYVPRLDRVIDQCFYGMLRAEWLALRG